MARPDGPDHSSETKPASSLGASRECSSRNSSEAEDLMIVTLFQGDMALIMNAIEALQDDCLDRLTRSEGGRREVLKEQTEKRLREIQQLKGRLGSAQRRAEIVKGTLDEPDNVFGALAYVYRHACASPDVQGRRLEKVMEAARLVRLALNKGENEWLRSLNDAYGALELERERRLAAEKERDDALTEHTDMMWQRRRAEERLESLEKFPPAQEQLMMTPKELYELRDRLQEAMASYENDEIGRHHAIEDYESGETPIEIRLNDLKFLNTLLARELVRYPESMAK